MEIRREGLTRTCSLTMKEGGTESSTSSLAMRFGEKAPPPVSLKGGTDECNDTKKLIDAKASEQQKTVSVTFYCLFCLPFDGYAM